MLERAAALMASYSAKREDSMFPDGFDPNQGDNIPSSSFYGGAMESLQFARNLEDHIVKKHIDVD